MTSMLDFFEERRKLIDKGLIGHNRNVMAFFNAKPERRSLAKANAMAQVRAERSDPFLYNRIMSHITDGLTSPDDYHVEFVPDKIETILSYPNKVDVLMPRNRKIP